MVTEVSPTICSSLASKALIGSKPMELVDPERREAPNCEHFSIRGYVAQIRKKDRNICWPFATDTCSPKDLGKQATVVPPRHASDLRWQGCESCLKSSNAVVGEGVDIYNNGSKANVSSSHGDAVLSCHGDAPKLLSRFPKASENPFGWRTGGLDSTPFRLCGDECVPSCSNKKEEAAPVHPMREEKNVNHMADRTISGKTNVGPRLIVDMATDVSGRSVSLGTDKHGRDSYPSGAAVASQSVCHHNKNASEAVILKSKGDGMVDNHGARKSPADIFNIRNLKSMWQKESSDNLNKPFKHHKNVVTDSGKCKVLDIDINKNESLNSVKARTRKLHPMDFDDSDSDYDLSERDLHDQLCPLDKNNSGGPLHQKKVRKVRLLTDILKSEALDASSKDHSSDRKASIDPTLVEAVHSIYPDPKTVKVVSEGTDRRVISGKKKKRKMAEDENPEPSQMNSPIVVPDKKVVVWKDDGVTGNHDISVVNCDPKGHMIKHKNEEKALFGKKRQKVSQVGNGQSFLAPLQEDISTEVLVTRREVAVKCTGDETVPCKPIAGEFSGRGLLFDGKANVGTESHDRKSLPSKKKKKISRFEDGKSSLMHWQESRSGKDHVIRRYVESKHSGSVAPPFNSSGDVSTGGLYHDLGHMGAQRTGIISGKQNAVPHVEGGGNMPQATGLSSSPIFLPKVSSATCNCENSVVLRKQKKIPKNQRGETTSITSKQATPDDIPMEIVELMAKNQHERRLLSAEGTVDRSYCMSGKTEKVKGAGTEDFSEILGNEMFRLLNEKNSRLQNVNSNNGRSSIPTTSKGVVPTKHKPDGFPFQGNGKFDCIHLKTSQPEHSRDSMGFSAFSQGPEKSLSGLQFPVKGTNMNCGGSFIWKEDIRGDRCPPNCFHSMEAYQRSHPQTVLGQNSCREEHHVWPSMVPNSFAFGLSSPPKLAADSSNLNMFTHRKGPLLRGNANEDRGMDSAKANVLHLQTHPRNFDHDTNKRTNSKYPILYTEGGQKHHHKTVGSLGLYANETIPAMHLLKLMDEGQKFTKPSSISYDCCRKEFSAMEIGPSKTNEVLRQPSSSVLFDRNGNRIESFEDFSSVRRVNTVGYPSQKTDGFKSVSASAGNVVNRVVPSSLKPIGKGKTKRKNEPAPRIPISNRCITDERSSGKNHDLVSVQDLQQGFQSTPKHHGMVSVHDLQLGLQSVPNYTLFPTHSQAEKDSSAHVELEINKKGKVSLPVTTSCSSEICTINRNPADFTIVEAGNMYMIDGRDLKFRKRSLSRDKSTLNNPVGNKQHRMTKLKPVQAFVYH